MQELSSRAAILFEALPYVRAFHGKTVVLCVTGAALASPELRHDFMKDLAQLQLVGVNAVLVHDGGPELSALLAHQQLPAKPWDAQATVAVNAAAMDQIQMVLLGKSNNSVIRSLNSQGTKALGLCGFDGALVSATKRLHKTEAGQIVDLGFLGTVVRIEPSLLTAMLPTGYLPVVAPLGIGPDGAGYLLDPISLAAAIAVALKAEKLVVVTDGGGLLRDKHDPASFIHKIPAHEVADGVGRGQFDRPVVPLVNLMLASLEKGVKRVHLLDGKMPHVVLVEIFTDAGIGTLIVP